LCLLFNELGLYVRFLYEAVDCLVLASSVIPMLARTRGPGTLKAGSNGLLKI